MKHISCLLLLSSFALSSCGKKEEPVPDSSLPAIRNQQPAQPVQEKNPVDPSPIQQPPPGDSEIPPPPSNPSFGEDDLLIQAALAAANNIRQNNLAPDLLLDEKLSIVAQRHADDMYARNYFDHTNPEKESPFDRMRKFGIVFRMGAENIARGINNAQQVMDGWLASPGHKANLINKSYGRHGIGYKNGYWVHLFAD